MQGLAGVGGRKHEEQSVLPVVAAKTKVDRVGGGGHGDKRGQRDDGGEKEAYLGRAML